MNKSAIIIGASGLIGSQLVHLLLDNSDYASISILVRKPLAIVHPKLKVQVVDFNQPLSFQSLIVGDELFICVGSTIKKAGSQAAFKAIDYEMPLQIARFASQNNMQRLLLVSALGANAHSRIFYSRIKGELEQALEKLPFKAVYFMQPSLLLGNRTENRPLEKISQFIMTHLNFLFAGPLYDYKAIPAYQVAKAMIRAAQLGQTGVFKWKSYELFK
jgi:uncharacterized protein YbjT (DUF2867 family)